tara:strand:+ start:293 stop:412 length:120 start_codon:yes stop_codon:yes gene_type:complete
MGYHAGLAKPVTGVQIPLRLPIIYSKVNNLWLVTSKYGH